MMYFLLMSLVALPAYPVNGLALLPYALAAATVKAGARGAEIDGKTRTPDRRAGTLVAVRRDLRS